jgi:hypothetical protein
MVNRRNGLSIFPGAYPGFHTLIDKAPGGPLDASWQAQNDGDVAALIRLQLSLDGVLIDIGPAAQLGIGGVATATLSTTYPLTITIGLHNGLLEMLASEQGGADMLVASHTFTVDIPAPPLGLVVTPIGDPTIV